MISSKSLTNIKTRAKASTKIPNRFHLKVSTMRYPAITKQLDFSRWSRWKMNRIVRWQPTARTKPGTNMIFPNSKRTQSWNSRLRKKKNALKQHIHIPSIFVIIAVQWKQNTLKFNKTCFIRLDRLMLKPSWDAWLLLNKRRCFSRFS